MVRLLGCGATSFVYEAELPDGKRYVVKKSKPDAASKYHQLNEIHMHRVLNGAGIVKFEGMASEKGMTDTHTCEYASLFLTSVFAFYIYF